MSEAIIDAKGLTCPQPVILTKKALDSCSEVIVIVDNATAVENIKRLASGAGCSVEVAEESDGIFKMHLKKQAGAAADNREPEYCSCTTDAPSTTTGPTVFLIASDIMGRGSDELGVVLMKAFIHTSTELEAVPDVMIFYNAGVKLAAEGSDVLDDLKQLEEKGVKMLVCGTCVNYFELTGKIAAGVVSNMYDIAGTLSRAGRIVKP
jgi:selenium metabolism protein YedF